MAGVAAVLQDWAWAPTPREQHAWPAAADDARQSGPPVIRRKEKEGPGDGPPQLARQGRGGGGVGLGWRGSSLGNGACCVASTPNRRRRRRRRRGATRWHAPPGRAAAVGVTDQMMGGLVIGYKGVSHLLRQPIGWRSLTRPCRGSDSAAEPCLRLPSQASSQGPGAGLALKTAKH